MSELKIVILLFVVTCVIIAISIWLIVKSKVKSDSANSDSISSVNGYMGGRRSMQFGDWVNAVVLIIIGVFLGIAINGIVQLLTTSFWPVAVIIPIAFVSVFLFGELFDGIVDRIFPSGIRPARKPKITERTPFTRLLSLPVGLIIGVIMAQLGFGDTILRLVS